ncbi:hypothetical protein [Burkholderia cepacia]|uniref:Uncharacterized protein n=1 Tax=Burkholderia cepacia TaxID=292 RepID=A0A8I1DJP2_BURCE|nr:hypothetical protein [Burkholderia cepacia]MBH9681419.1 hypothetical protein [Burkholderia cepacia]MBH9697119.1 hypothetical protein [Burkholderia cepacia]MBH9711726.1 hypothetical protein [Burkholderia cepacia]MBH9732405.1 hypothetical protein [Burkholderia cepacia]MBX3759735.1 hypothetical protein [Burkholderia cepacia]
MSATVERPLSRPFRPAVLGCYIDAIATLDAIVTSAVMSYWLHRRLDRRR